MRYKSVVVVMRRVHVVYVKVILRACIVDTFISIFGFEYFPASKLEGLSLQYFVLLCIKQVQKYLDVPNFDCSHDINKTIM